MKKYLYLPALALFPLAGITQSLFDDPMLWLYLGKNSREMQYRNDIPYFNYTLPAIPRDFIFAGCTVTTGFINEPPYLNGKGKVSLYGTGNYGKEKKIYSIAGTDGSLINGGFINLYMDKNTKHHLSISGNHRYFQQKTDKNDDGFMDQPLKNDIDFSSTYYFRLNKTDFSLYYSHNEEHSLSGEDTLDYLDEKNIFSLHRFENHTASDILTATLKINIDQQKRDTDFEHFHDKKLIFSATGAAIKQRAYFSTHEFNSRQQHFVSRAEYRYGNQYDHLFWFNASCEWRMADIKEQFDSVALSPWKNAASVITGLGFKLSPVFTISAGNRTDYFFEQERLLHNPSLYVRMGKRNKEYESSRHAIWLFSQLLHRFSDPVAENLPYISSDKTIYILPVYEPDKWLRTGIGLNYDFSWKHVVKVHYYYDHYFNRTLPDVFSQPGVINFYSASSSEHTTESEITSRLFSERFITKAMYRFSLPVAEINGKKETLPFYSPHSCMFTFAYRHPWSGSEKYPEVSLSWFLGSKTVTGVNENKETVYSKPLHTLNFRATMPLQYLNSKLLSSSLSGFLTRFTIITGCDNLFNYRQHDLYTLASGNSSFNSVNTWGQFYGRRWYFSLLTNLNKRERH